MPHGHHHALQGHPTSFLVLRLTIGDQDAFCFWALGSRDNECFGKTGCEQLLLGGYCPEVCVGGLPSELAV